MKQSISCVSPFDKSSDTFIAVSSVESFPNIILSLPIYNISLYSRLILYILLIGSILNKNPCFIFIYFPFVSLKFPLIPNPNISSVVVLIKKIYFFSSLLNLSIISEILDLLG